MACHACREQGPTAPTPGYASEMARFTRRGAAIALPLVLAAGGCDAHDHDILKTDVFVQGLDGNEVAASEDPSASWTYVQAADGSYADLVFLQAATPPFGATIVVDYTCGGSCGPAG